MRMQQLLLFMLWDCAGSPQRRYVHSSTHIGTPIALLLLLFSLYFPPGPAVMGFLFLPSEREPKVSPRGSYMVNTLWLVDSHIENNFLISLYSLTYCFFSLLALRECLWFLLKSLAAQDAPRAPCSASQNLHHLYLLHSNACSCLFAVVSCHWGIRSWTHFFHGLTL